MKRTERRVTTSADARNQRLQKIAKERNDSQEKIERIPRSESIRALQIDFLLNEFDGIPEEDEMLQIHVKSDVNTSKEKQNSGRYDQIDNLLKQMDDSDLEGETPRTSSPSTQIIVDNIEGDRDCKTGPKESAKSNDQTAGGGCTSQSLPDVYKRKVVAPLKSHALTGAKQHPSNHSLPTGRKQPGLKSNLNTLNSMPNLLDSSTYKTNNTDQSNQRVNIQRAETMNSPTSGSNDDLSGIVKSKSETTNIPTRENITATISELSGTRSRALPRQPDNARAPVTNNPNNRNNNTNIVIDKNVCSININSINRESLQNFLQHKNQNNINNNKNLMLKNNNTNNNNNTMNNGNKSSINNNVTNKGINNIKPNYLTTINSKKINAPNKPTIELRNRTASGPHSEQGERDPPPVPRPIGSVDPLSELLITERNFVLDIEYLHENFLLPLQQQEIISKKLFEKLALNLECLLAFHKEILFYIQKEKSIRGVTQIFSHQRITELEQIYSIYISNYQKSLLIYYDQREKNAIFRQLVDQINDDDENKAIANLMIAPVQRVSKYEQILSNVITHFTNNEYYHEECKTLQNIIRTLHHALDRINNKRNNNNNSESCWENLLTLERSMQISEPISIPKSSIIYENLFFVRNAATTQPETNEKLLLFNDSLIRIKPPSAYQKQGKVVDLIPFSNLQIIDPNDSLCSIFYSSYIAANRSLKMDIKTSFYLVDQYCRTDVLEVRSSSEKEKSDWIQIMRCHLLSEEKFIKQWNINIDHNNEKILAADTAVWPQAFIHQCRIFITPNYVLIAWKMIGCVEREVIPISSISSVAMKENVLTIYTTPFSTTNQSPRIYHFTLQNIQLIYYLLTQLTTKTIANQQKLNLPTNDYSSQINDRTTKPLPFHLSDEEWESIWKLSKVVELEQNGVLDQNDPNLINSLFKVLDGFVITSDLSQIKSGELFGVSSFITGNPLPFTVRASPGKGARILQLNRTAIHSHYQNRPEVLAKFFAMLALKVIA